jgi:hypothetical protein
MYFSNQRRQKYIFGHSSQPPETEVKAVPITMVTPAPPTAHVVREASVPATDEVGKPSHGRYWSICIFFPFVVVNAILPMLRITVAVLI